MPHDPERIFNAACAAEKHPRARIAREILISLPHELPLATQRILVRGYCLWLHDRFGISSMAAIHHPLADGLDGEILADMVPRTNGWKKPVKPRKDDRGNPLNQHVHILCPVRVWDDEAQRFGKKARILDDVETGPVCIQQMRNEWERRVNRHLVKAGVKARVDLRSYEKAAAAGDAPAGLTPQPKLGPKNSARGRRRELESGRDDTFLGEVRAKTKAANSSLCDLPPAGSLNVV
jgi:MobA/MobL family.